jgi:hypothetical protein
MLDASYPTPLLLAWMAPLWAEFTAPTARHALVLVTGAVLAPARRTVAAALRATGYGQAADFTNYHRVLNRNRWSPRHVAQRLLLLLVQAFTPEGPVIIGLDDTLERRWGAKIKARGIYRDPVRSSHGHFVKASGLRWLSVMLLPPVPWTGRVWALPFLTVLAPSERYAQKYRRRHKKLTDWERQVLLQVARWLPDRRIVAVADSSYAVIDLLNAVRHRLCVIARLRLDARLFEPPPQRRPRVGRPRILGRRLPSLSEQLASHSTRWHRLQVTGWYGRTERLVEIVSGTAIWSHPGHHVPIRYVLVRDCKRSSARKRSCVPISQPIRSISCAGLFAAGAPRSPSPRSVAISASKLNVNGPIRPSLAPPPPCSACSPSSRSGLISIAAQSWPRHGKQAGIQSRCRPLLMLWPQCAVPSGRASFPTRPKTRQRP